MCPRTPAVPEEQSSEGKLELLEVTGGTAKGGIIVRADRDKSSVELSERLSTGSVVRALEQDGGRVHYELVSGSGPLSGWVSAHMGEKPLLTECQEDKRESMEEMWKAKAEEAQAKCALQVYGALVAAEEEDSPEAQPRKHSFPWMGAQPKTEEADVSAELNREIAMLEEWQQVPRMSKRESQKKGLHCTFGFATGTAKEACYARFDVRDEVCRRFGGFKHGQVVSYKEDPEKEFVVVGVKVDRRSNEARLWVQPQADSGKGGALAVAPEDLERLAPIYKGLTGSIRKRVELQSAQAANFQALEDSDGEGVLMCRQCRLPVGTTLYCDEAGEPLHAECLAQRVQRDLREKEEALKAKEAQEKLASREKYNIGWAAAEMVPSNALPAQKLALGAAPRGMCCLALEEGADGLGVRVLPTMDPACAVNLEYLSLALKVRQEEGREPTFSLDPVLEAGKQVRQHMQLKNFEPRWLQGTSVGEVLFQSDYHLKELSMGEQGQPVLGMRSCFDLSLGEAEAEWRAREWYVVRAAEMQISEDNVLIPQVQLGVEAREQVLGAEGLEDKPLTRPDHPLVRYAEEFSENFELIAERRSVVHHLRHLARASLLAKFLLETKVALDDSWLDLASPSGKDSCVEIPQLWHERTLAEIQLKEGRLVDAAQLRSLPHRGVYGGVKFGLDRFRLGGTVTSRPGLRVAPAAPVRAAMPTLSMSDVRSMGMLVASMQGKGVAPPPTEVAVPEAVAAVRPSVGIPGLPTMRAGAPVGPAPVRPAASAATLARQMQGLLVSKPGLDGRGARMDVPSLHGVDLNLDQFNLDEPVRVASLAAAAGWGDDAAMAKAFWQELDGEAGEIFSAKDRALFREIFNPYLSDRREEGEKFAPPDPSSEHLERLRELVDRERELRQQRQAHFLSVQFCPSNPGELFPASWLAAFEISREEKGAAVALPQGSHLQLRADYLARAELFEQALKEVTPVFDRATEDGLLFRIYKLGSVEVRTTQQHGEKEVIGAVFSVKRTADVLEQRKCVQEGEKVVKVTEFVESVRGVTDESGRRSYVVVETEAGNLIVTEKHADGTICWEENPDDLEDRNSLAKFIRASSCSVAKKMQVTVKDMIAFREEKGKSFGTSTSGCKHYVQATFNRARGCIGRMDSGFGSKGFWRKEKAAKDVQKECRKETRRSEMLAKQTQAKEVTVQPSGMTNGSRKVINPIIVGTWDDWTYGEPMVFDEESRTYFVELEVGPDDQESFQILCESDWDLCLHPDSNRAPADAALCGPDCHGHGKNWTIGVHEEAPEGAVFCIMLRVNSNGLAEKVEWERVA